METLKGLHSCLSQHFTITHGTVCQGLGPAAGLVGIEEGELGDMVLMLCLVLVAVLDHFNAMNCSDGCTGEQINCRVLFPEF